MRGCATVVLGICAVFACLGLAGAVIPGISGLPFGWIPMPLPGVVRWLLLLLVLIVTLRLLAAAQRSQNANSRSWTDGGSAPAARPEPSGRSVGAAGANGEVSQDVLRDYETLSRRVEALETILMERTGKH